VKNNIIGKIYNSPIGFIRFAAFSWFLLILATHYFVQDGFSLLLGYLFPVVLYSSHKFVTKRASLSFAIFVALGWAIMRLYSANHVLPSGFLYSYIISVCGVIVFVAYLVAIIRDEQIKLTNRNLELEILNAEKNRILGIAAHDLRNPISVALSYSELLLENETDEPLSKDQRDCVNNIRKSAENTLDLLDSLLQITRMDNHSVHVNMSPFDFVLVVNEVINSQTVFCKRKKQTIQYITKMPEIIVNADKSQIIQVLTNLISNAIKYSYYGGEIKVIVGITDDMKFVYADIIDFGMGINPEEQKNVFVPFSKTMNVPTGGEKSSGLGLSIAKRIIEIHGGNMYFVSETGKGSTFSFRIPL